MSFDFSSRNNLKVMSECDRFGQCTGKVSDLEQLLKGRDAQLQNQNSSTAAQLQQLQVCIHVYFGLASSVNKTLSVIWYLQEATERQREGFEAERAQLEGQRQRDLDAQRQQLEQQVRRCNHRLLSLSFLPFSHSLSGTRQLEAARASASSEAASLQAEVGRRQERLEALEQQHGVLKQRLATLTTQMDTQTSENASLKLRVDELFTLGESSAGMISGLQGEVTSLGQRLDHTAQQLAAAKQELDKALGDLRDEQMLRKRLRNEIEDMKGKVRVYCRVRPLSSTEHKRNDEVCVALPDPFSIRVERKDKVPSPAINAH